MIMLYVVLFSVMPILSIPTSILGMIFSSRRYKIYTLLFCLSIGLLAYNLIPIPEYDLTRYYDKMELFQHLSMSDSLSLIFSSLDPLSYLIMYLVSFTGDERLLQFLAVSFGYWLLLTILLRIFKIRQFKWYINLFFLGIFLCSFEFIQLYSGFRNLTAIAVFLALLYDDLFKNRQKSILFYFIPALIHSSMIIPTIVLLLVRWNKKIFNTALLIIIPIATLGLQMVKEIVHQYSSIHFFELIDDKLQWYDIDYSGMFHDDYYLFKIIVFIFAVGIFLFINRAQKGVSDFNERFAKFTKLMIYITACMVFNLTFFTRYSTFVFLIVFYYYLLNIHHLTFRQKTFANVFFVLVSLITLYGQYVYISLLGIHEDWLPFITSTIFNILG